MRGVRRTVAGLGLVPETAEFAVDTPEAPSPVLGAEPDDQVAQLVG